MLRRSAPHLSWLLVPLAAVLVQSAVTLDRQPYTGIIVRDEWVAGVVPDSPGARAGLAAGDRIESVEVAGGAPRQARGPLAGAVPGRPLTLVRVRGEARQLVWLVPEPQPIGERRMLAMLLLVASGFVLIGGWVWSERRDPLARTFFLLCLAFAFLLAPLRTWVTPALQVIEAVARNGVSLYLPALFVHFFALFPESRARGGLAHWVVVAYAIASFFFLASLADLTARWLGPATPTQAIDLLNASAAVWFAVGLLAALVLFGRSYLRAGTADARRRLRVALVGTVLGAAPLAGVIVVRNVSPGTAIPGERWAVVLTLLVPASFAWATAVHRVFDFRVALRAMVLTAVLALAGGLVYAAGEWIVAVSRPELGAGIAGGGLAFVALAAALAGPAAPWLGSLGARMVPASGDVSLAGWASRRLALPARAAADAARGEVADQVMDEACETVAATLKLDGCMAFRADDTTMRAFGSPPSGGVPEPGPGLRLRAARLARWGLCAVDESPLDPADREALRLAGVSWLLPIGSDPVRAVMLLGRRLAGSWLGRREALELDRFAEHLAVALENAALRHQVRSRGAIERELAEAGAIQAHLLPRRAPIHPTLDCAAAALSCEPVGGDYYDFVEGPGRDFTLAVGDAAGHGVPAALLLAQVQARFRDHARRGLGPGQLLQILNHELLGLDKPEKFVALLCARVEVRSARVWFANAGLPPPILRRRGGAVEEVAGGGTLLGVRDASDYPDVCVTLGAGDVVVVHTDGLTEARRGDTLFGTERVAAVLERCAGRRAVDILQALLDEVRAYTDRPLDDLTVVVLRQLSEAGAARNGA